MNGGRRLARRGAPAFAACSLALGACSTRGTDPPLATASRVDLARCAGTWYEIARYPNRLQARCAADVAATYTHRAATPCRRG